MRYALASLLLTMVAVGSESAIRQHYSRLQSFSAELLNAEGQRFRLLAARGKALPTGGSGVPAGVRRHHAVELLPGAAAGVALARSRPHGRAGGAPPAAPSAGLSCAFCAARGDTVELRVEPLHGGAEWFQGALLWLRRSDWAPLRVELSTAMGPQRWQVRNFRANPALSPDTFRFRPPPGTEVLELGQ
jgi:hypothetical protein